MKKIGLFILTLCCFMIMPKVMAASASTVVSGTNTITVGSTTQIYIKLNSSDKIEGVAGSHALSAVGKQGAVMVYLHAEKTTFAFEFEAEDYLHCLSQGVHCCCCILI